MATDRAQAWREQWKNEHSGSATSTPATTQTTPTTDRASQWREQWKAEHAPSAPQVNTPPPGYNTGATIVNALSGITGRTAEPYKPKPANAQPTRQESRANDLDERFTPEPVKTPALPTPPKPIVGGGGFDDFSNSAAALANAAPLAAARGRGEPVTNIYEQRQQTQQAQNRYDELNRQIQEYDLALGMAYTPEDQAEIIEKRKPLIEQRDQLVQANPDIVNHERAQGAALRGSIHSGADQAVGGITSFLDNVLGDVAQDVWSMIGLGSYDNPITALNKLIQKETKQNQEYFGSQVQGDKTAESIYKYGSTTVAAIPAAVMAYATAGGSMATTAGLQTTAYLNTLSGAEQTLFQVGNAVKTMMANPSWQFSFVQESGNAYQNALDSGMSEADASVYSMLYGYLSATVEVGGTSEAAGGLETFAKEVQNPKGGVANGLLSYAKSIVGEIGEENVQGMLERGLQSFFGQDTAVFSNDPTQNAIIQPQTMGEEAKGAAVVSALLGLPGTAIRSSNIEAQQNVEPVETQSVDDALTPDLRPSQIVRNELARAAFEERYGVTLPSSNTEAERVVSQILRASQFTPTDVNPSAQPAETTQADVNPETQQEITPPVVNYTPAQESVIDILTNPRGVQFSDANRILSDTNLWTAFQSLFPNVDTNQSRSNLKEDIRNVDLSDMATPEQANPVVQETTQEVTEPPAVEEATPAPVAEEAPQETLENAPQEDLAPAPTETPPTQQPLVKPVDNRPEIVRERGGSRTLRTDTARNEALRDFKDKHRDLYRQLKNSQTLSKALDIYETGYDNALVEVQTAIRNAQDGKKLAPEIVPLSKIVCDEMAARGDVEGANRIYSDIAAELTYAGQLGQANAILRDASPIAKADALQKTLAKVAKEANADMSAERIAEIANEYRAAQTDEARDAIVDNAIKEIANMSPTTLREAFTALRYLNMLGNFKTQGRNLLGNTGMLAVSRAKNRVKALGQMATNAVSMALTGQNAVEQTNTLTTDAKLYKEAVELFAEDKEATLGERKYSDVAEKNRAVSDAKTIFKWNWNGEARNATEQAFRTIADMPMKVLEKYRKATRWAMEAGDAIFTKVTYAQTLADYAKAQGYKSLSEIDQDTLSKMRDYAIQQAQEATFRDTNSVSDFASTFDSNWGQKGGVGKAAQTVVRGIVPFRKTPANVGVRMFEYSPLEIISTAVDAVKLAKGDSNITLNDVIDDAAKTITGTALAALGYALAKAGLARGKEDDDKLSVFEKNTQSMADYSLVLTDGTTVSMDWLTPESGAFFLGVAAADTFEDGVQSDDFLTLLGATSDVALNMSFLSGIQDALENITSYNGDMDALPQFLLNSYLNYVGQALTNSLVGQAEQASEQNRQTTFSDPDSAVPTTFQYTIGKASAKTPGWDYNQADYIDAWGRKQDNGDLGGRILESFFSPAYINEDRSTPVDDELKRLYEATGANVLPAVASRSTQIDGERLTPEEYETYQTTMGQRSLELVSSVINGKGFSDMSDDDKAEAIAEMYSYAKDEAKRAVQEQRGITVEPTNLERQYEKAEVIRKAAGLSWPEYYQFKEDLSIASGGNTPSMEELVRFLQEGEYKNPHKIYDAYFPTASTSYTDKVEAIRKAEEQEAEAKKAGWESAEQFKQDQQAMAEFKTEQKNEYDTSSMVAISNYIRNADRTDEQKDMLMAGSSNAFSKSYASVREQSGLTPDEVIDLLLAIDNTPTSTATAGNGNIAQAELKAYYKEHPEDNDVLSIIFGVVKPGADWDIAKTKK